MTTGEDRLLKQLEVRWGVQESREFDVPAGPYTGVVPGLSLPIPLCWVKDKGPRVWSIQIYTKVAGLNYATDQLNLIFQVDTGVGSATFTQYFSQLFAVGGPKVVYNNAAYQNILLPAIPAEWISVSLVDAVLANTLNPLHKGNFLIAAAAAPYTRLRDDHLLHDGGHQ